MGKFRVGSRFGAETHRGRAFPSLRDQGRAFAQDGTNPD